jgi:hypothetical protein
VRLPENKTNELLAFLLLALFDQMRYNVIFPVTSFVGNKTNESLGSWFSDLCRCVPTRHLYCCDVSSTPNSESKLPDIIVLGSSVFL